LLDPAFGLSGLLSILRSSADCFGSRRADFNQIPGVSGRRLG